MMRNQSKEIRGRILKILEVDYPNEVSDRVVSLTLGDINYQVSPPVLAGFLDYLEEKGYAETRELDSRDLGVNMRVAKLTARGKDLLEGNIEPDVGVSF